MARSASGTRTRAISKLLTAVAVACPLGRAVRADVIAEWQVTGGGDWITSTSSWSTNPNYPNNGTPAGTNYQVDLDVPSVASYTVVYETAGTPITVDQINISTANAQLQQTTGTLTVGSMNISAGKFQLRGGTFSGGASGATVAVSGTGQFQLTGATLDHLNFTGATVTDSSSSKTVSITNGLDFGGGSLNMTNDSQTIIFDGASQTLDNINLSLSPVTASKKALLDVGGSHSSATIPVTLTLGAGANVSGAGTIQDNPSLTGNTLINNGILNANLTGQTLSVAVSNFTNTGTLQAGNGGILSITSANWGGSGAIQTTGTATLNLGGNFSLSSSQLNLSNATSLSLSGSLANTGSTVAIAGLTLNGGSITGGTLLFNSLSLSTGTFDGVLLNTPSLAMTTSASSPTLYIDHGLTGVGQTLTLSGNDEIVTFDGASQHITNLTVTSGGFVDVLLVGGPHSTSATTVTIDSNATLCANKLLFLDGNNASSAMVNNGSLTELNSGVFQIATLGSFTNNGSISAGISNSNATGQFVNNGTITTNGQSVYFPAGLATNSLGASISITNGSLNFSGNAINSGSISISGGELITSGSFSSPGSISLTNGSLFSTTSPLKTSDFANYHASADSTTSIQGSLNNTGSLLDTTALGGNWIFNAVITNGTVNIGGLKYLRGTLDGVTFTGSSASFPNFAGNSLTIKDGFSNSRNALTFSQYTLTFDGPSQTIDNAQLNFNDAQGSFSSLFVGGPASTGSVTLTLGTNCIITSNQGATFFSYNNVTSNTTLINNGTLSGIGEVETGTFINNGLIKVPTNIGLRINGGANFINHGTIQMSPGCDLIAEPALNVGDGTLDASGTLMFTGLILNSDPSTIAFNIGGTTQGTAYDFLDVQGTLQAAGYLDVTLDNNFQSSITSAESFTILRCYGITGTFLNLNSGRVVTTDGTGSFQVNFITDPTYPSLQDIVLTNYATVPEPANLIAVVATSALFLRTPRKRKKQR